MKHIQAVLFIFLVLSLCNICNFSGRFRDGSSNGNSNSGSSSSGSGSAKVEKAQATTAQAAAIAGGKQVKWDQQGMSWTIPEGWTEETNELEQLVWRSPGGWDAASLIVSISPMDESFPTEISLESYFDQQKTQSKNGKVDEFKWIEIDGVKGVQFRESNPPKPDDHRRLQWLAYRKYGGQVQFVNVMLASSGKGFPNHQDAMYGILYSMKLVH